MYNTSPTPLLFIKKNNLVFSHRYPGGFKQVTAAQLHQKDPKAVSLIYLFFATVITKLYPVLLSTI